jgi:transcriptional regulator with XRE-family HTH domain
VPRHQYRKTLGNTVRHYRLRAELTQEQFAEKAELSSKYVGEIERGTVNVSVDSLMRMANALHVSIRDFFRDF